MSNSYMEKYIDENGINRNPYLLESRSKRVGEIIGGQYRLNKVTGITKFNEALYEIECMDCGHIYNDARIPDINRKIKNKEGCKHGSDHTTYNRWTFPRIGRIYKNMITRCYNPNSTGYMYYGGKGITICDEWLNDHTAFEKWSLENGYSDDKEINRKDPNKGYCPENCEWVPRGYNSKFDKTNSIVFCLDGKRYTMYDLAEYFSFNKRTVASYYKTHGYENTQKWLEDMYYGRIEVPYIYSHTKLYNLDNCYCMSLTDWAKKLSIKYTTLYLHSNHTKEKFNEYLRQNILDKLGVINVFGYSLTLIQISNITGLNMTWLKEGYIKYGSVFLFDAMKNNGVTVVDGGSMI